MSAFRTRSALCALFSQALLACAATGTSGFVGDAGSSDGTSPSDDASPPFVTDGASPDGGGGPPLIYANTDKQLYTMDPVSKAVTLVGAFDDGTAALGSVTDLAVNRAGEVWVNTESAIYRAVVPQAPGTVKLTKVTDISLKASQKFYALGFTLAGTLGASEKLIAGDNLGDLYAVESNGTTVLLGGFGTDAKGNRFELSGDVMFFAVSGNPRGVATLRSCKGTTCTTTNDVLAEIDVAAMQTAYSTNTPATLRKGLLGTGSGFGRLFGIGAWNDSVYAFSRSSGSTPAQLVQIGASGTGKLLQSFPAISAGWSGAGVTTSASVTILPN